LLEPDRDATKALRALSRSRGCTHQHAIRILGRAWCGVIWRLWQDRATYDPVQHTGLQRVLAAGVDTGSLTRSCGRLSGAA